MSDYKRLTKKDKEYGNYVQNELSELNKPKVAVSFNGKIHGEIIDRLAELEDKIENETLVELPCKVGDTVYMIWIDTLDENNAPLHKIQSGNIFAIQLEHKEGNLDIWLRVEFGLTYCCRRIKDFYLTKAEAEAKLKELKKENEND